MAYSSNDQLRYDKIKEIYDAKVAYNNATTDAERQKQNTIATNARKTLEAYGYKDVADQLSATGADATQARKILEQYSPNKVTDTNTKYSNNTLKTGINNDAYNNRVASGSTKNDIYFNTIQNDHTNVNNKYTDLYNYANQDITQTDEYKSTFANIMPQYNLKAMQGRESELASGSSANGGNIDSFSAANALRQQSAITAKGQALAHQMGLEAANSRISNVNNILSNLGVYNSSVYSAMSDSVNNDRNLANDIANNEQTALNNQAAREEVYSNISGTVGDTVTKAQNSGIWNSDGSLKNDAQNFQADIETLEKALYSTTNESEKAKIKEQLRVLELARNQKIDEQGLTYGKTYKYQTNPQTVADKQFDEQNKLARETLGAEVNMNNANNQNKIDQIKATTEGEKDVLKFTKELTDQTTGYTLTDEDKNLAELVVKNINANLKTHTSNPDGRDLISYKDGTVLLNLPSGHVAHWWSTQILKPLFQSNLNAKACYAIARELGFSEEDITSVANAIK